MALCSGRTSPESTYKLSRVVDIASILIAAFVGWLVKRFLDEVVERRHEIQIRIRRMFAIIRKRGDAIITAYVLIAPFCVTGLLTDLFFQPVSIVAFVPFFIFGLCISLFFSMILDFLVERLDDFIVSSGERPLWWMTCMILLATVFPVELMSAIGVHLKCDWELSVNNTLPYLEEDSLKYARVHREWAFERIASSYLMVSPHFYAACANRQIEKL